MTKFSMFGYDGGREEERKWRDCISPRPTILCQPKMHGKEEKAELVVGWF